MMIINYVVIPLAVIIGLGYALRMIAGRVAPGQVGVLFRPCR